MAVLIMPIVRTILKSMRSPRCPAKNIPREYTARNATSISPSKVEPSAVLNGDQPMLRLLRVCNRPQADPTLVWGSSSLLTMLVIFRVIWKQVYAKNVRTKTSVW
uniref:Uncharacterized protein n=1 Tax=Triticum urartu TaxID=4572 RepID=A0A8R7R1J7_TRIUA